MHQSWCYKLLVLSVILVVLPADWSQLHPCQKPYPTLQGNTPKKTIARIMDIRFLSKTYQQTSSQLSRPSTLVSPTESPTLHPVDLSSKLLQHGILINLKLEPVLVMACTFSWSEAGMQSMQLLYQLILYMLVSQSVQWKTRWCRTLMYTQCRTNAAVISWFPNPPCRWKVVIEISQQENTMSWRPFLCGMGWEKTKTWSCTNILKIFKQQTLREPNLREGPIVLVFDFGSTTRQNWWSPPKKSL